MSFPAVLHIDPSEAGRERVAAIHRRVAPASALSQFASADSARLALDAGAEFNLALVAINLGAPGEGLKFVKWLRARHPLGPVAFVLEDRLEPCDVADALESGAEGLIPMSDHERLIEALAELFDVHLAPES